MEKQYNNLKENLGFPGGMGKEHFLPGAIVKVQWDDAPDQSILITEIESHAHNYKGEREFNGIDIVSGQVQTSVMLHTQITGLVAQAGWTFDTLRNALHKNGIKS